MRAIRAGIAEQRAQRCLSLANGAPQPPPELVGGCEAVLPTVVLHLKGVHAVRRVDAGLRPRQPPSEAGQTLLRRGQVRDPQTAQTMFATSVKRGVQRPAEPWCAVLIHLTLALADPSASAWLGDFERCVAWAWVHRAAGDDEPDDTGELRAR